MNEHWTPEILDLILRKRGERIKRMNDAMDRARRGESEEENTRISDVELFEKMNLNTRPN